MKKLSVLKKENDVLSRKRKILNGIVKKTTRWSTVLDSIRNSIPEAVQIETINIDKSATIQGSALDFQSVSNFAINLATAPGLSDAVVQNASRRENNPESISFVIVSKLSESSEPGATIAANTPSDAKKDTSAANILPNILDNLQKPASLKKAEAVAP